MDSIKSLLSHPPLNRCTKTLSKTSEEKKCRQEIIICDRWRTIRIETISIIIITVHGPAAVYESQSRGNKTRRAITGKLLAGLLSCKISIRECAKY